MDHHIQYVYEELNQQHRSLHSTLAAQFVVDVPTRLVH
jgi:hypothetical protein